MNDKATIAELETELKGYEIEKTAWKTKAVSLKAELKAAREQIAALESKEVCNCPHDDSVLEGCPYCRIEAYKRLYEQKFTDGNARVDMDGTTVSEWFSTPAAIPEPGE